MKLSLLGITIEVYKSRERSIRERRRRAMLVLEKCGYSNNVISRIEAVRSLGLAIFTKEAKEWVESAFLDNGKGDIA